MSSLLKDTVDEYIESEMQECIDYVKVYKMQSKEFNYEDYVEKAIVFWPEHMWNVIRFNRFGDFKLVGNYIKENENIINNSKNFDEILLFMNKSNIKSFSKVSQYDKALAMGIYLNLMPNKVFVHAGPRIALKYRLGREYNLKVKTLKDTNKIEYIDICDLPIEFDKLTKNPYLIEICLCKYYHVLKENKLVK